MILPNDVLEEILVMEDKENKVMKNLVVYHNLCTFYILGTFTNKAFYVIILNI